METGPTPPQGPPGPESPPPQQYPPPPQYPPGQAPPGGWQQPVPAAPAWAGPPLASWGTRAGAALLDLVVLLAALVVLVVPGVVVLVASDGGATGIVLLILGGLAYIVGSILYAPYFMQRGGPHNGQTLGKQWLGIRVVRDSGEPFGFGWALLREFVVKNLLFASVGGFFLYIPTLLDWLWPLWDDQNRALHDMVASTHVVSA